jgi:hypothetical protein
MSRRFQLISLEILEEDLLPHTPSKSPQQPSHQRSTSSQHPPSIIYPGKILPFASDLHHPAHPGTAIRQRIHANVEGEVLAWLSHAHPKRHVDRIQIKFVFDHPEMRGTTALADMSDHQVDSMWQACQTDDWGKRVMVRIGVVLFHVAATMHREGCTR